MTIAVAYWVEGIASMYTRFEKVKIQTATCTKDMYANCWRIDYILKNSGSATATMINVFVNEVQVGRYGVSDCAAGETTTSLSTAQPVEPGQTLTVAVYVSTSYPQSRPYSSGTAVSIKFHSTGGMDYVRTTELV